MPDTKRRQPSPAELAVRLVIALADFCLFAFAVYAQLILGVAVPWWLYGLIVAILGAMLGRDILKDYFKSGPPGG